MNEIVAAVYETGKVEGPDGQQYDAFPASVLKESSEVIDWLIRNGKAKQTLEVGLAWGLSALTICEALEAVGGERHTAIDPFQSTEWHSVGLENIRRAGFEDRFRLFEEPSHAALPRILVEMERDEQQLDFAFIDGEHLFDYVMVDFFYVDKMLRQGGVIVFDDMWMEAVQKVVSFATTNLRYEKVGFPEAWNLAVLQKAGDDPRNWDTHIAF